MGGLIAFAAAAIFGLIFLWVRFSEGKEGARNDAQRYPEGAGCVAMGIFAGVPLLGLLLLEKVGISEVDFEGFGMFVAAGLCFGLLYLAYKVVSWVVPPTSDE